MALSPKRRAHARAANAHRPALPLFDTSSVRRFHVNNFELFFFNDLDWIEKIRGYEQFFRFHRVSAIEELIADIEREYRD